MEELTAFEFGWPGTGRDVVEALMGPSSKVRLEELRLATCDLTEGAAESFSGGPAAVRLRKVVLVLCSIDTVAIESFSRLPLLEELSLHSSDLDERALAAFSTGFVHLRRVKLEDCKVPVEAIAAHARLRDITDVVERHEVVYRRMAE
jgi:hypothetical protein